MRYSWDLSKRTYKRIKLTPIPPVKEIEAETGQTEATKAKAQTANEIRSRSLSRAQGANPAPSGVRRTQVNIALVLSGAYVTIGVSADTLT
jgi:hypothetical protein